MSPSHLWNRFKTFDLHFFSDGAGRTGTYCLIDMVLNRMAKGAKEIDIAAALEHIRDQRPGMVATKQQFEFVLVAVAEEVHAILKALPVQLLEKEKSATTTSPPQSTSGSDQWPKSQTTGDIAVEQPTGSSFDQHSLKKTKN